MKISTHLLVFKKGRCSLRRRRSRSGQTLVEYGLLLAYVSLLILQGMTVLGFQVKKSMVYSSTALVLGNHSGDTPAAQKTAVANYVSDPSIWGNADPTQVAAAIVEIETKYNYIIDNPGS